MANWKAQHTDDNGNWVDTSGNQYDDADTSAAAALDEASA